MVFRGRGGLGNHVASSSEPLQVPVSHAPIQHISSPQHRFRTGRGGFGNTVQASQTRFTTPEEYLRQVQVDSAEPARYMIGRGGMGNHVRKYSSGSSSSSDSNLEGEETVMPYTSTPGLKPKRTSSSLWQRARPTWTR